MNDQIMIYLIVLLNALCQTLLIWRLRRMEGKRWLYMGVALLLPLLAALAMRGLVAWGAINSHLAQQSRFEQLVTSTMSMLLLAGPWLVTMAALLADRGRKIRAPHPLAP